MLVADQITFSTKDLESNLTLDPIVTRISCDVHRVKYNRYPVSFLHRMQSTNGVQIHNGLFL